MNSQKVVYAPLLATTGVICQAKRATRAAAEAPEQLRKKTTALG
jgi:hypothetical protein